MRSKRERDPKMDDRILKELIDKTPPDRVGPALGALMAMRCDIDDPIALGESELFETLRLPGEYLILQAAYTDLAKEVKEEKIKYKISEALSVVAVFEEDGRSLDDIENFVRYIRSVTDPLQRWVFGVKRVDRLSETPVTLLFGGILPINKLRMRLGSELAKLIFTHADHFIPRFAALRLEISRKIAQLKRELEEVRAHRERYRARRRESHLPLVALVGYTNAGKSTLINALTPAHVLAEDKLFATLDPTTRKMTLPSGREALITDTVGFIQKLPTDLVAAFRATLEEILEADLIIHVVDASHPNAPEQAVTVEEVLDDLGAAHIPVVVAFNKIDLLPDERVPDALAEDFPDAVPISALHRRGLDALLQRVEDELVARMQPIEVFIPYNQGELVDLFHTYGVVETSEHRGEGVFIRGKLPPSLVGRFEWFERMPDA
jgi:small GTP-binding protein